MPNAEKDSAKWTAHEDNVLNSAYKTHGENYRLIKKELGGSRLVADIKERVKHLKLGQSESLKKVETPKKSDKATPLVDKIIRTLKESKPVEPRLKSEIKSKPIEAVIFNFNQGVATPTAVKNVSATVAKKDAPVPVNVKEKALIFDKDSGRKSPRRTIQLNGTVTPSRKAAVRARKVTSSRLKSSFTASDLQESPMRTKVEKEILSNSTPIARKKAEIAVGSSSRSPLAPVKGSPKKEESKVATPTKKSAIKAATPEKKAETPVKNIGSKAVREGDVVVEKQKSTPRASKRKNLTLSPENKQSPRILGKRGREDTTAPVSSRKSVQFDLPSKKATRSSKRQRLIEQDTEAWSDGTTEASDLETHQVPAEYNGFLSSVFYRIGRQLGLI